MPYVSRQQEKWAHTPEGEKALGGKAKVKEWDAASAGKKLPRKKLGRTTGTTHKSGRARFKRVKK